MDPSHRIVFLYRELTRVLLSNPQRLMSQAAICKTARRSDTRSSCDWIQYRHCMHTCISPGCDRPSQRAAPRHRNQQSCSRCVMPQGVFDLVVCAMICNELGADVVIYSVRPRVTCGGRLVQVLWAARGIRCIVPQPSA